MAPAVDDRTVYVNGDDGGPDGVGQQLGGGPGGRRGVAAPGAVDADDGMKVDSPALLVLGDLGEGHPGVLAERPLREAGALGDLPAQVDREAPPQRTGVRVPEHGRFVV